jgi:hypothetical protein
MFSSWFSLAGAELVLSLLHLEKVTQAMDASVYVIYQDSAKAFDKVPNSRLSRKTQCHGIAGKVLV